MKDGYVKSSPRFFRLITRSALGLLALLLIGAWLIPAPLQEAANRALTPNPAKSAWFLLWIQEVVSWSRYMIYPVMAGAFLLLALPWLGVNARLHRASWFPRTLRFITVPLLLVFLGIILLTIIALYFRGPNWMLGF